MSGVDNTKDIPQPPSVDNSVKERTIGQPKTNKPEGMSRNHSQGKISDGSNEGHRSGNA